MRLLDAGTICFLACTSLGAAVTVMDKAAVELYNLTFDDYGPKPGWGRCTNPADKVHITRRQNAQGRWIVEIGCGISPFRTGPDLRDGCKREPVVTENHDGEYWQISVRCRPDDDGEPTS